MRLHFICAPRSFVSQFIPDQQMIPTNKYSFTGDPMELYCCLIRVFLRTFVEPLVLYS